MTFVCAGREIETVDGFPRSKRDIASGLGSWPLLQSYAYHWGIEVKFDPVLDEVFGITNEKQRCSGCPARIIHDSLALTPHEFHYFVLERLQ